MNNSILKIKVCVDKRITDYLCMNIDLRIEYRTNFKGFGVDLEPKVSEISFVNIDIRP